MGNGEADNGYTDDSVKCKARCELGASRLQYFVKSDARAVNEVINARFKIFNCLHSVWRHPLDKHGTMFRACAVITELSLDAHPTWKVDYGAFPHPGPVHPLCFPKEGFIIGQNVCPWPFRPMP